jgi:hypothetical protein
MSQYRRAIRHPVGTIVLIAIATVLLAKSDRQQSFRHDTEKGSEAAAIALPETLSVLNFSPIGMIGFEPTTPASRKQCATKLRYIPPKFQYTTKKGG